MNVMGYETKTTFWQDFAIAEHFGSAAIRDTYKRAFEGWRDNVEYLTELVMVLNWRIWLHYENGNEPLARLYNELWRKADSWCCDNLTGDDARYYFSTTD